MIRSSTQILLDGRAAHKKLASSLTELGYSAQETSYILEQAELRIGRVRTWKKNANAVSDRDFMRTGGFALI